MKKLLCFLSAIIVISLFQACHYQKEVVFSIDEINDNMISMRIVNNSDSNYFITLDTTRSYKYDSFNDEINNCIILKTNMYDDNGHLIGLRGNGYIHKPIQADKNLYDCFKKDSDEARKKFKKFVTLENAIIVGKRSVVHLKVPFKIRYQSCNFNYFYPLEKNRKYFLEVEYKMIDSTIVKNIAMNKLDSIQKLKFFLIMKKSFQIRY